MVRRAATTMTRRGLVIAIRAIRFSKVHSSVWYELVRSANCRHTRHGARRWIVQAPDVGPVSLLPICRPAAFAGRHGRSRSPTREVSVQSGIRDRQLSGICRVWEFAGGLTCEEAWNMLQRRWKDYEEKPNPHASKEEDLRSRLQGDLGDFRSAFAIGGAQGGDPYQHIGGLGLVVHRYAVVSRLQ